MSELHLIPTMNTPSEHSVCTALPAWISSFAPAAAAAYPTDEDKMALAIALAKMNVRSGTGGPFGAAVFESLSGKLVSLGVNRVVPENCSLAHGEIMALMLAQKAVGSHRLNSSGTPYTLATSAQPCAMCFGAIMWAGIDTLLIGARREDVESITGFDEGPIPEQWIEELNKRGISVIRDILQDQCCQSLREYAQSNGELY